MAEKKQTILIVEDEKPMAHVLSLKLKNTGFDAIVAGNGVEAFEVLDSGTKVDLVILDLMMPEMGGIAFLKERKKRKLKVPVVVATNLNQPEDEKLAKELGAKDFFVKSNVSIKEIIEKISQYL